jgi:hypothetical protein
VGETETCDILIEVDILCLSLHNSALEGGAVFRRLAIFVPALFLFAGQVRADYVPSGVQTNVPVSTVLGGGWSIVFQDTYADNGTLISTVFAGVSPGDYVMLAARPVGSDTFTLLAAGLDSDVQYYTPYNTTHTANGVNWYYNGASMGFAGAGQSIYQSDADIMDASGWGHPDPNRPDGSLRLSWHTFDSGGPGVAPTILDYGWRAGNNIGLNGSSDWERDVLVLNASPVPEPGRIAALIGLVGTGLIGLVWRRRTAA